MNITILNVGKATKVGPSGKPYEVLDLAYKNNTFQGKVEGKALMPFGANAGGFNVLKNAQAGQTYEITVVKNDKGYNDWTNATPAEAGAQAAPGLPQQGPTQGQVYQGSKPAAAPARTNTFETPEERSKKQVYIVRQSSLSAAINSLSPGAKSALDFGKVIEIAKHYEAYVFDTGAPEAAQDVDQPFPEDDIPY